MLDREDQIRNYKLLLTEIALIQISSACRGIVHNIHKRSISLEHEGQATERGREEKLQKPSFFPSTPTLPTPALSMPF